ncbi:MAG: DUF4836 family protein [Bacteroidetes bacterium]|nr:DUF4836 family protein [Bacteroidota bacterium]
MKKKIVIGLIALIILSLGAWLIFGRKSREKDAHLILIPAKAAAVMKIDVASLASKADLSKLIGNPVLKEISDGQISSFAGDPLGSGLDLTENIYGFLAQEDKNAVSALVFAVTDAEKFSSFLTSTNVKNKPYQVEETWFCSFDQRHTIAWNNFGGMYLSCSGGNAEDVAKKYFAQKKENSILSNKEFENFNSKKADLSLLLDNRTLSDMGSMSGMISPFGINEGFGQLLINFNDENISADYSSTSSVANNVLRNSGASSSHFFSVAPADPVLYMQLSANSDGLISSLKKDASYDDVLSQMESALIISDVGLGQLFTGDISIAFSDFKNISDYDPRLKKIIADGNDDFTVIDERELAQPITTISIGITNDAIVNSILEYSGMKMEKNFYEIPGVDFVLYAVAKNKNLIVTNDYFAADTFSQTGMLRGKLPDDVVKECSTNSFCGYASLAQEKFPAPFITALQQYFGENETKMFLDLIKPFSSAHIFSNGSGSHVNITLAGGDGKGLNRILTQWLSAAK